MTEHVLHEGCRALYRRVSGVASDGRLEGKIVEVVVVDGDGYIAARLPSDMGDRRLAGMVVSIDSRLLLPISRAR